MFGPSALMRAGVTHRGLGIICVDGRLAAAQFLDRMRVYQPSLTSRRLIRLQTRWAFDRTP